MERACKQLPRSYKLWKMVKTALHLQIMLFLLTLIVPGVSHKTPERPQPNGISRRIPKGQCPLRTSSDPPQQNAAHLGNVSLLPTPATSRNADPKNVRLFFARPASYPTQPHLEALQGVCTVRLGTNRNQNFCALYANSPGEH